MITWNQYYLLDYLFMPETIETPATNDALQDIWYLLYSFRGN